MKKILTFSTLLFVLASTFWFNTETASAAPSNLASTIIFYIPGITSAELASATMFIDSETVQADCALKDAETGQVVCHIPGKYAGQAVIFYIAGQIFYVNEIPEPHEEPPCNPIAIPVSFGNFSTLPGTAAPVCCPRSNTALFGGFGTTTNISIPTGCSTPTIYRQLFKIDSM